MRSSNYTRTSYLMALFTERYTSALGGHLGRPGSFIGFIAPIGSFHRYLSADGGFSR